MYMFSSYNKIILTLFLVVFSPMAALSLYMEPESNELTRMGGYLENYYGWNDPQENFEKPLFTLAKNILEYDSYYDVVVLGDSFSENLSHGWQNYFSLKTGLKIITLNMNYVSIDSVLDSKIYREKPPLLFIYQSVERNIVSRNQYCPSGDFASGNLYVKKTIEVNPHEVNIRDINRNRKKLSVDGLDFNLALNYMKKSFNRNILGRNITEVHQFSLTRKNLFSNKKPDSLLVITRDFKLKGVTQEQIKTAQCSLLALQQRIRSNDKTGFVALFFPDKTTVYADVINDDKFTDMSIIKRIESTRGLNSTSLVRWSIYLKAK